jgi:hypothetical protein
MSFNEYYDNMMAKKDTSTDKLTKYVDIVEQRSGFGKLYSFVYSKFTTYLIIQSIRDYFSDIRFKPNCGEIISTVFPAQLLSKYINVERSDFDTIIDANTNANTSQNTSTIYLTVSTITHLTIMPESSTSIKVPFEENDLNVSFRGVLLRSGFIAYLKKNGTHMVKIFHGEIEMTILEPKKSDIPNEFKADVESMIEFYCESIYEKKLNPDDSITSVIIPEIKKFECIESIEDLSRVSFVVDSCEPPVCKISPTKHCTFDFVANMPEGFTNGEENESENGNGNEKQLIFDDKFIIWVNRKGHRQPFFTGFFIPSNFTIIRTH